MNLFLIGIAAGAALLAAPTRYQSSDELLFYNVPEHITLHEPLLAKVAVTNRLGVRVHIDFGFDYVGELDFVLLKPSGVTQRLRPVPPDGISAIWRIELDPGTVKSHDIVLNQWLDLAEVGLYKLTILFRGTVKTDSGQAVEVDRSATTVINVLPRSEATLRAACDRLFRQAMSEYSVENYQRAVTALAYTRDPIAAPFLEELAGNNRAASIAIYGLVLIGGPDARTALQRLSRNPDPAIAASAKAGLAQVR